MEAGDVAELVQPVRGQAEVLQTRDQLDRPVNLFYVIAAEIDDR